MKRAAFSVLGVLHIQLGPGFKALCFSLAKKPASKDDMEKCFDRHEFDASVQTTEWSRCSIVGSKAGTNGGPQSPGRGLAFDIPKTDLFALLPDDCLDRMVRIVIELLYASNTGTRSLITNSLVPLHLQGCKEGKTAWKMRKQSLEEVDQALKQCSGLLDTSAPKVKRLLDLTRGIRDRLSDTQINLKPVAARLIGSLLAVVDKTTQAKLGKVVQGPLIRSAMNDIKKPMREACLASIRSGFTLSSVDGEGLNEGALAVLATALVGEVNESSVRVSLYALLVTNPFFC